MAARAAIAKVTAAPAPAPAPDPMQDLREAVEKMELEARLVEARIRKILALRQYSEMRRAAGKRG